MYWWESCRHCFYYCKGNFTILICCQHSDSGVKLKFQLVKLNWFPSIKFTNTPDFYPGLRSLAFRVSSGHIQDTQLERFRERQDPTPARPYSRIPPTVQMDMPGCFFPCCVCGGCWRFSFAFCFSSFLSYLEGLLRQPFCLFAFLFLGDGLKNCLLYNVTNLHP